jgi:hypothetical protein
VRRRQLLLLACAGPAAAQQGGAAQELRIAGGSLPPVQRRIVASKGDRVRLRVSSDKPGELHLHAYRIAARVEPGRDAHLDFTAFATGRFPVSWHADGAAAGDHSHAPLAWLEVRPR